MREGKRKSERVVCTFYIYIYLCHSLLLTPLTISKIFFKSVFCELRERKRQRKKERGNEGKTERERERERKSMREREKERERE